MKQTLDCAGTFYLLHLHGEKSYQCSRCPAVAPYIDGVAPEHHKRHGRTKPYSEHGIKRLPCFRCGRPASHQWQICADDNIYRPICLMCDMALNALVLRWMNHPEAEILILEYNARIMEKYDNQTKNSKDKSKLG